jgi:HK97 family phage portal protein
MYDNYNLTYAALYREQPNVRTCVDFLARNIAQLNLHFFRRLDETDRQRLTGAPVVQLLNRPLPPQYKVTRYRLFEAIVSDLGVYFNSYLLKLRQNGETVGLLRIPPEYMAVGGGLITTGYEANIGGVLYQFVNDEIIHFKGYSPESSILGLSPLETLRRVLAEENAMGEYREGFWKAAARISGVIHRPASAPLWSEAARQRFALEFQELYSGNANSGKTAILEEDMKWEPNSFNAQESEYLGGRKLTREECARAYHIPLPMVGILDNATFSNIQEQHKHLYQDTLGPILAMIEQDIAMQLLPDFADTDNVYCEFNINEKMQGDFAAQTSAMQSAVGRPWMTADEARARFNMPMLGGDAGQLVTPLNVLVGGQASPTDSAPPPKTIEGYYTKAISTYNAGMEANYLRKYEDVFTRHYQRQERAYKSAMGAKAMVGDAWVDSERWNRELTDDLFKINNMTALAWGEMVASEFGADVSESRMQRWLQQHSRIQAEQINAYTEEQLTIAANDPEPGEAINKVFTAALTVWALRQARSALTTAVNFGSNEGANAAGLRSKTWRVNSANPRDSHAALNGATVGIRERFANGLRWPGDPDGSADELAGCDCTITFS